MKTVTPSEKKKKRMTVYYSSWFIAGAWKDFRKKMRENNYTFVK